MIEVTERTPEWLIDHLDVFQEHKDPCEQGHVEHGPEDHLGRRLVHAMAGFMGADWDYDAAVEFIRASERIGKGQSMGHIGALKDGRWIGFAVKDYR